MKYLFKTDKYAVHLNHNENVVYFECYPICYWESLDGTKKGFNYIDKENEPDERDVFEKDKCLMKLEGSYCDRGVLEGRLYFPDAEYWDEDIEELSRLYNDEIIPICKKLIKNNDKRIS